MVTIKGCRNNEPYFIECSVPSSYVFEKNGETFAYTKGGEEFMEFTHLKSGQGLNGNNLTQKGLVSEKFILKSFEAGEERVGAEFWPIIKRAITLEEHLLEAPKVSEEKERRRRTCLELMKTFNGLARLDKIMLMCNVISLDILELEEKFKNRFPEEYPDGMSMRTFVTNKYGADTADKLNSVL